MLIKLLCVIEVVCFLHKLYTNFETKYFDRYIFYDHTKFNHLCIITRNTISCFDFVFIDKMYYYEYRVE